MLLLASRSSISHLAQNRNGTLRATSPKEGRKREGKKEETLSAPSWKEDRSGDLASQEGVV